MHAGVKCSLGKPSGCLVIDAIVSVFIGKSMGYPGKMDHGIAIMQKGLPVEWCEQIRQLSKDYIRVVKIGRPSRCGDYSVTPRSEITYEMASNETVGAGD